MTEYKPRLFHSDAVIEHLGEGLVARTLTRPEWTHEAHLAATSGGRLFSVEARRHFVVPDVAA
jgi:hypothetical protein